MGCGCFPNKNKDIVKDKLASKAFLSVSTSITQRYIEDESKDDKLIDNKINKCKELKCDYLQRIIYAIKFYHNIDIIKDQIELIKFVNNKYIEFINDYHHILFVHENDIEEIHNLLLTKYNESPCKLNTCYRVSRNIRNLQEEEIVNYDIDNNQENNIELTFWINLFDSLHCYFLHIYDYGYRIPHNFKMQSIQNEDDDDDDDIYFKKIKEYIMNSKKILDRANDNLILDTFRYNLIFPPKDDESHIDFNIGLKFYYWDYYKKNNNYVVSKYKNFKNEILNNNHYALNQIKYNHIIRKTEKMMNSLYAKSLSANFIKDHHYGIDHGSPFKIDNMLSIVLYCDYDILSQALSNTFYPIRINEQLFSIKKRHSVFRNWSKLLRETVDYYGISTSSLSNNLYIGCYNNIIISSLSIRIRAPTSTSKKIQVALRFINDIKNGIILKLSHNKYIKSIDLKTFPCNWISNFKGENEMLLMGGKYTLRIYSLINIKNNYNFKQYFKCLYYFDLMLSGIQISIKDSKKINNFDYKFMDNLINNQCKMTSNKNIFGDNTTKKILSPKNKNIDKNIKYITKMFDIYCNNKKTIIIDLISVLKSFKIFDKLIINEKIKNLLLLNHIGLLFKKVTEIGIYATTKQFEIDLLLFLNELNKPNCKNFQRIQIRCKHDLSGSWLCQSWNTDMEFKYYTKKWKATFTIGQGTNYDDVLTLNRQRTCSSSRFNRSQTVAIGKSVGLR